MSLLRIHLSTGGILIFLLLSFLGLALLTFIIYRIMWARLEKIIEEKRKEEEKPEEKRNPELRED